MGKVQDNTGSNFEPRYVDFLPSPADESATHYGSDINGEDDLLIPDNDYDESLEPEDDPPETGLEPWELSITELTDRYAPPPGASPGSHRAEPQKLPRYTPTGSHHDKPGVFVYMGLLEKQRDSVYFEGESEPTPSEAAFIDEFEEAAIAVCAAMGYDTSGRLMDRDKGHYRMFDDQHDLSRAAKTSWGTPDDDIVHGFVHPAAGVLTLRSRDWIENAFRIGHEISHSMQEVAVDFYDDPTPAETASSIHDVANLRAQILYGYSRINHNGHSLANEMAANIILRRAAREVGLRDVAAMYPTADILGSAAMHKMAIINDTHPRDVEDAFVGGSLTRSVKGIQMVSKALGWKVTRSLFNLSGQEPIGDVYGLSRQLDLPHAVKTADRFYAGQGFHVYHWR